MRGILTIGFLILITIVLAVFHHGQPYPGNYAWLPTVVAMLLAIVLLSLIQRFLIAIPPLKQSYSKEITLALVSVAVALIFSESIIRKSGLYLTHSEKTIDTYNSSRYTENLDSWLWRHPPLITLEANRGEFEFNRKINSLGLSELEIQPKTQGEFRIITIGDSFTEGVGTTFDSTWVKLLEETLNEAKLVDHVSTINAGIGGSDVVYGCMLYEQLLSSLESDLVVITINSTDLGDICMRGGSSRFLDDGTVRVQTPIWEILYQGSHFWRLITHKVLRYDWNLIPKKTTKQRSKEFTSICMKALNRLNYLCVKNGATLLVVTHPTLPDVIGFEYEKNEMNELVRQIEQSDLKFLDLQPAFKNAHDPNGLFWPIDGHFNHQGNKIMSEALAQHLIINQPSYLGLNVKSSLQPQTD